MLRAFGHRVATCWVLLAQVWKWSNVSQQHPTCRSTVAKRTQHVAPNNVAICCVGMLRSFGRGFSFSTCAAFGTNALYLSPTNQRNSNSSYLISYMIVLSEQ